MFSVGKEKNPLIHRKRSPFPQGKANEICCADEVLTDEVLTDEVETREVSVGRNPHIAEAISSKLVWISSVKRIYSEFIRISLCPTASGPPSLKGRLMEG